MGFTNAFPAPDNPATITFDANNPGAHHTTTVADLAAGSDGYGVAPGARIYFGGLDTTVGNRAPGDINEFYAAVDWLKRKQSVNIFNFSFTAGIDSPPNNLAADHLTNLHDILIVAGSGNSAYGYDPFTNKNRGDKNKDDRKIVTPALLYNGITVGATDRSFSARAHYSSYWVSPDDGKKPDVRIKPDVLAPGSGVGDRLNYPNGVSNDPTPFEVNGTSGSAPIVSGIAALLVERGLTLGDNNLKNHVLMKSVLLNSARKRGSNGENAENARSFDNSITGNEASDDNYLDATGQVRIGRQNDTPANPTRDWNPSEWSNEVDPGFQRRIFKTRQPLDDEQGAGVVDATRAVMQFAGGQQTANSPGVSPIGWDARECIQPETAYLLNFPLTKGQFITATLTWDVTINRTDNLDFTFGGGLDKFDLKIFRGNDVIAWSQSRTDNVEHLHFPVPADGAALDYRIVVAAVDGGIRSDYALTWWAAVPEPASTGACAGLIVALLAKRRRTT